MADGKNNQVTQYNFRATWPFPILYTPCRELLSPTEPGNCQGMLGSSSIKALTAMGRAGDQFATRRVANFTFAASEVATEESSIVREGWGESL